MWGWCLGGLALALGLGECARVGDQRDCQSVWRGRRAQGGGMSVVACEARRGPRRDGRLRLALNSLLMVCQSVYLVVEPK